MSNPKDPARARALLAALLPRSDAGDVADDAGDAGAPPEAHAPDARAPSKHDERFLDAIYDDVGAFLVDHFDRFPELDTLETYLQAAHIVADLERILAGDAPPPPPQPPLPLPDPAVLEQRTVLSAAMIRHLAEAEAPDVAALVSAYDRGLAGEQAATSAGLDAARHADAMVRLKGVLDVWHQLAMNPERSH
jgi:hypothetical protein